MADHEKGIVQVRKVTIRPQWLIFSSLYVLETQEHQFQALLDPQDYSNLLDISKEKSQGKVLTLKKNIPERYTLSICICVACGFILAYCPE